MFWPITIIATTFLVTRNKTHTGRAATYDVRMQTPGALQSRRARERCIEAQGNALALINVEYLKENPGTPKLYHTGLGYCDVGFSRVDMWQDIPTTLQKRCGNCTALAPWRLAELWLEGHSRAEARAVEQKLPNGNTLFHLFIDRGDGTTEDPSERLGMP